MKHVYINIYFKNKCLNNSWNTGNFESLFHNRKENGYHLSTSIQLKISKISCIVPIIHRKCFIADDLFLNTISAQIHANSKRDMLIKIADYYSKHFTETLMTLGLNKAMHSESRTQNLLYHVIRKDCMGNYQSWNKPCEVSKENSFNPFDWLNDKHIKRTHLSVDLNLS